MITKKKILLNILYVAHCLGNADSDFAKTELQTLKKLVAAFNLTMQDLKELQDILTSREAVKQLESIESRELLVDVLFVLAAADGYFHDTEKVFTKKVMELIDLDPGNYPIFWENSEEFEKIFGNLDECIEMIKEKADSL